MFAISRYLRIKKKKAVTVASMIRGQEAEKALNTLRYLPKKCAQMIYKTLRSAISNAENNDKIPADNLYVKEIIVNKGPELRRIRPVSRGRAHGITKGVSHISVRLGKISDNADMKVVKKAVAPKKAVKVVTTKEKINK